MSSNLRYMRFTDQCHKIEKSIHIRIGSYLFKGIASFCNWGDFNIMRHPDDKNTDNFDTRWMNLFHAVIETLQLKEIVMSNRQYTWVGLADNLTYKKLAWVLVSTE
jgi:hypothetical protein